MNYIPRPELEKYLSILALQQRPNAEATFTPLLNWIDHQKPHALQERTCQPGEIILPEGEHSDIFYIIRSGHAIVLKGELDDPTIIGFRTTGDAIGEMGVIDNLPRSATVIALTPISLWGLGKETFHQFLAENPTFGLTMMSVLSSRIRESDEERLRGSVRERKKEEVLEDLSRQAAYDPLTGLFNRRQMEDILREEQILALQRAGTVGILMADIDHFKKINDTYGHRVGDLMLQAAANLLKGCVRAADSVCRYGGEEFVIIMPGVTRQNLLRTAEDIRARFEALRVEYEGQCVGSTISLGGAIFPEHGNNLNETIEHADQALYQAKRSGRNQSALYQPQA